MVAFRTAAITWGPEPVRTRRASSPLVTSRTECERFSIDQWPRTPSSNWPAFASDRGTRVRNERTSVVVVPSLTTTLATCPTGATPGQSR